MTQPPATMQGKICLVTGATSGLGSATARALALRSARVLLTGRDPKRTSATAQELRQSTGNPHIYPLVGDFLHLDQVHALAQQVRDQFPHLDVLVNNAGAFFLRRKPTPYGAEATFVVNHLAPFLLTLALLDLLTAAPQGRVINVASEAHRHARREDFHDLAMARKYSGWRAYARSKLANLLFTYELARRLPSTRITVNAVHPGLVATRIWRVGWPPLDWLLQRLVARRALTPEQGADTQIYLATAEEVAGITGRYFIRRRPVPSSSLSYDAQLARWLWEISLEKIHQAGLLVPQLPASPTT